MNYKIIFSEEQYDLLTSTLEKDIENENDVESIRALVKILDKFENDYQESGEKSEIDHSIDVRHEPDVIKAFNKFIEKWCGGWYPHLIDSDDNDGQFMREKIEELIVKR